MSKLNNASPEFGNSMRGTVIERGKSKSVIARAVASSRVSLPKVAWKFSDFRRPRRAGNRRSDAGGEYAVR